ncbi:MAG: flagellar motor switch protein FliN [Myxococcota bacterium]
MAEQEQTAPPGEAFTLLHDVPLAVTVELGKVRMTIQELLDMGQGSVVELDRLAGEPVDILVNGRPIAMGEIVIANERYAVRVVSIRDPADRLETLS